MKTSPFDPALHVGWLCCPSVERTLSFRNSPCRAGHDLPHSTRVQSEQKDTIDDFVKIISPRIFLVQLTTITGNEHANARRRTEVADRRRFR